MSVTQVQTPGYTDSSVTTAKIANDAVTIDKITFENALVPVGGIIMWSGSTAPTGWALCDGQNGTPDLRDRFIVGAGSGYIPGDTGGANTVTLTVGQMPSHKHGITLNHGTSRSYDGGGGDDDPIGWPTVLGTNRIVYHGPDQTDGSSSEMDGSGNPLYSTGGGEAHENRPPYYALAFIMRVS